MIADLKPYRAMKDSGVPWLGEVPEHWELRRTKALLKQRSQKGFPDEPLLAATQTKGVVRKEQYEHRTVLAQKDLHLLKLVCVGDFVISLRSFQGGIEYARERGIISPAYTVLYPKNRDTHRYLAWLFKSKPYIENLTLHVTGIREGQNIDYEKLSRSRLPLPPLPEQAAIVRFLDHVDRRVRRYIRAKQKLIGLLEEQKQAIIHRAVTRGLDPDVPLKPSGVEWLGDVPEHWRVVRAKLAFDCVDVRSNTGEEELLTVSSSDGVVPREGRNITMFKAASYVGHKLCWPEDLVINSLWAWANGLGFSDRHGIISTAYGVYRLRKPYRSLWRYLDLALRSGAYQWQLQVRSKGIWKSRLQLTDWSFLDMPLVLPPDAEGNAICEFVQKDTGDLRQAISSARREIDLVREYHTRLIADVVTGNLDVREVAANLPDEPLETEPLDEIDELVEESNALADHLDVVPEEDEQ